MLIRITLKINLLRKFEKKQNKKYIMQILITRKILDLYIIKNNINIMKILMALSISENIAFMELSLQIKHDST